MTYEAQRPHEGDNANNPNRPAYDPVDQVGDIYAVDLEPEGVRRIEKLRPRPATWACSLADYNAGLLHGAWIDADQEPAELHEAVATMLAASPTNPQAEEWAIFEYDGFGAFRVGEHESLEVVSRIATGIAEHGLAFAAYADTMGADPELLDKFDEAYLGHYDSAEAYAEQLIDDLGYQAVIDQAVPESLRPYARIDTAALARDLELGGDIAVLPANSGGVWIFDAR